MSKGQRKSIPKKWQALFQKALEVQKKSHSPYSGFAVGCALEDEKGRVFTGCNVENANFCESICAERTAIVKMVSEGGRKVRRIAIITQAVEPCFPCGGCLQVIQEFGLPKVIAIGRDGLKFEEIEFDSLLPRRFSGERLKEG